MPIYRPLTAPFSAHLTQIRRTLSPAIELGGRPLSNSLALLCYSRDYIRFQQVARPIAVTFDPHADELQYVGRVEHDVFDHVLRIQVNLSTHSAPLHPCPGEQIPKPFIGDFNFHHSPCNSIYPLPSLICRRRTMTAAPLLLPGNFLYSV